MTTPKPPEGSKEPYTPLTREALENDLLGIVAQLPFMERGRTLSPKMYPELIDYILARDRAHKRELLEARKQAIKEENQRWYMRAMSIKSHSIMAVSFMDRNGGLKLYGFDDQYFGRDEAQLKQLEEQN